MPLSSSLSREEPFAHQEVETTYERPCSVEQRVEAVVPLEHALALHHLHEQPKDWIVASFGAQVGAMRR